MKNTIVNGNVTSKIENAKLLKAETTPLKKVKGEILTPTKWAIIHSEREDGDNEKLKSGDALVCMTEEGTTFATNSNSFIHDFLDIAELMGDEKFAIRPYTVQAKNGECFKCEVIEIEIVA